MFAVQDHVAVPEPLEVETVWDAVGVQVSAESSGEPPRVTDVLATSSADKVADMEKLDPLVTVEAILTLETDRLEAIAPVSKMKTIASKSFLI